MNGKAEGRLTEKSTLSVQVNYDRAANGQTTTKEGTVEVTSGTSQSKEGQFDGAKDSGKKTTRSELTTPLLPPKGSAFGTAGPKARKLSETNDVLTRQQPMLGLRRGLTNPKKPDSQEGSMRDTEEQFEFEDIALKTLREPGVDKTNILDSFALAHFDEHPGGEPQANET